MIIIEATANDFWNWLQSSDSYKHNFSYDGAHALFNYLEEMSSDENLEFDPVSWCCEYAEYTDLEDLLNDFSDSDYEDLEDVACDHTIICNSPTIVISQD